MALAARSPAVASTPSVMVGAGGSARNLPQAAMRWHDTDMDDPDTVGDREVRRPHESGRVRVLAVATHWSSEGGGISTFNRRLCRALAAAGADVHCLMPEASPWELADAAAAGVNLVFPHDEPNAKPDIVLHRRASLPSGVVPDLILGHGRVTGPAARAQTEFFPHAVHVYLVHSAPDEVEFQQSDGRTPSVTARTKTLTEARLAGEADRVVAVGPASSSGRRTISEGGSSRHGRRRSGSTRDSTRSASSDRPGRRGSGGSS